jgi:hypothetical protein
MVSVLVDSGLPTVSVIQTTAMSTASAASHGASLAPERRAEVGQQVGVMSAGA